MVLKLFGIVVVVNYCHHYVFGYSTRLNLHNSALFEFLFLSSHDSSTIAVAPTPTIALYCIVLGFKCNLSPQPNSVSNHRPGVYFGYMSIDAGRSPTLHKTRQSAKHLQKPHRTDRVPEVHVDRWAVWSTEHA
jgi:hypothetical protein